MLKDFLDNADILVKMSSKGLDTLLFVWGGKELSPFFI